jgi:hypothetical protein
MKAVQRRWRKQKPIRKNIIKTYASKWLFQELGSVLSQYSQDQLCLLGGIDEHGRMMGVEIYPVCRKRDHPVQYHGERHRPNKIHKVIL